MKKITTSMNLHKTIVKIVPFTYFARNDFYESKILKIKPLPRSGCQPITHFIRFWDNCAYFVRKDFDVPLALEISL